MPKYLLLRLAAKVNEMGIEVKPFKLGFIESEEMILQTSGTI